MLFLTQEQKISLTMISQFLYYLTLTLTGFDALLQSDGAVLSFNVRVNLFIYGYR